MITNNGRGVSVNSRPFSQSGCLARVSNGDLEDALSPDKRLLRDSLGSELTSSVAVLHHISHYKWLKQVLCFRRHRGKSPLRAYCTNLTWSCFQGLSLSRASYSPERLQQAGKEDAMENRTCQEHGSRRLYSQAV